MGRSPAKRLELFQGRAEGTRRALQGPLGGPGCEAHRSPTSSPSSPYSLPVPGCTCHLPKAACAAPRVLIPYWNLVRLAADGRHDASLALDWRECQEASSAERSVRLFLHPGEVNARDKAQ